MLAWLYSVRTAEDAGQAQGVAVGILADSGAGSGGGSGGNATVGGSGGSATANSSSPAADNCTQTLWNIARDQPDLLTLVAVQQLTTLNFFTPFGKASKRDFTLLAPTDAAFAAAFNDTTETARRALQKGFAPLLLYHQVLLGGYSAAGLAAQYFVMTALGKTVNEPFQLEVDKEADGTIVVAGMAPDNYANVLREYEACGAHLLVIDALLEPVAEVSQLPLLLTEQAINASAWQQIEEVIQGGKLPPGLDDDEAAEVDEGGEDEEASSPGTSSSGGNGRGGSGSNSSSGAGSKDEAEAPSPQGSAVQVHDLPPSPPAAPPNCTSLAASGKLINANGTLATTACAASGTVVSSGSTQTAVSDGSGGAKNRTGAARPPPPASTAASPGGMRLLAVLAPVLAWLLLAT